MLIFDAMLVYRLSHPMNHDAVYKIDFSDILEFESCRNGERKRREKIC